MKRHFKTFDRKRKDVSHSRTKHSQIASPKAESPSRCSTAASADNGALHGEPYNDSLQLTALAKIVRSTGRLRSAFKSRDEQMEPIDDYRLTRQADPTRVIASQTSRNAIGLAESEVDNDNLDLIRSSTALSSLKAEIEGFRGHSYKKEALLGMSDNQGSLGANKTDMGPKGQIVACAIMKMNRAASLLHHIIAVLDKSPKSILQLTRLESIDDGIQQMDRILYIVRTNLEAVPEEGVLKKVGNALETVCRCISPVIKNFLAHAIQGSGAVRPPPWREIFIPLTGRLDSNG